MWAFFVLKEVNNMRMNLYAPYDGAKLEVNNKQFKLERGNENV